MCGAFEGFKLTERHRRQDRSRPRPEVLRCNIPAGDFLEIIVDVSRGDVLTISCLVHILKQFLPRQFLTCLDDLGYTAISDPQRPLPAALTRKAEAHFISVDCDVSGLVDWAVLPMPQA